ncbi:carbohydrate ABC transporter permease [Marispirochaeta aestuarii]|uniref:carbohydrate ABC transporter permease n=1 Tax=Marispirochaeta aestuarii TaxID=1963862 RepID=UPI0029C79C8D|nr:carbohydrate ABC transporter permease [Marispirochaeta aestuarii]
MKTAYVLKKKKRVSPGQIIALAGFIILGFILVFPLYYLVLASFRQTQLLFREGMALGINLEQMTLENYAYIFSGASKYANWYFNSIAITSLYALSALIVCSVVGYGLAVYDFKGRNIIFGLVLFVMMIPLEILMLPLYQIIIKLKLVNTYTGVILPYVAFPLGIFFFRQYAISLPRDYLDAGRIDGCTEYGLFFRIMAPLMLPAYGAMAILLARKEWNNFVWPLVVLRTSDKYTLPIGLASQIDPYGTGFQVLLPGAVLAILPPVLVFIFGQKYFISGLTVGGIKG